MQRCNCFEPWSGDQTYKPPCPLHGTGPFAHEGGYAPFVVYSSRPSHYELYPRCYGAGKISRPPDVPVDLPFSGTSTGPWTCNVCHGTGVLFCP